MSRKHKRTPRSTPKAAARSTTLDDVLCAIALAIFRRQTRRKGGYALSY